MDANVFWRTVDYPEEFSAGFHLVLDDGEWLARRMIPEHFCFGHAVEFERLEAALGVGYPHRLADGSVWCREGR